MKLMKKIFVLQALIAGLMSTLLASHLYAEGTKEYTSDAGIYNVVPFSIGTVNGGSVAFNFNMPLASAPEGLQVCVTTISQNINICGWYIENTTGFGNFTIQLQDFSDYAGGSLRFWFNSPQSVIVGIQDNAVQHSFTVPGTGSAWKEIEIPFSSFSGGPIDLHHVQVPFIVEANPTVGFFFYLDHIRWTKPLTGMAIFPTTSQVNLGKNREFTVEGRNGSDVVIIYSSFTAASGTISPAAPTVVTASTLTASGNTSVKAQLAMSTSAAVTVTVASLDTAFGLLSETIPGVNLNVDSGLGTSNGSGDTIALGDSPDHVEGIKSFVSTVTTGVNGFAGWYIQWGVLADQNSTRDMSNFYDGTLRFWFKSTAGLSGKLKVGIRSINVTAGTELSAVYLSNANAVDGTGNIFDGNWHPMQVPISAFARARPWADISRSKVLFSAYAVGNGVTGANGTFYVDNLRWDTHNPGPLSSMTVTPTPITIPLSSKRIFTVNGFDINGSTVDVLPTWSTTVSGGAVSQSGVSTVFTAPATAASGNVTATKGSVSGSAAVTVAAIPVTQSYNVYSDLGAGGSIGVSFGGAAGTGLYLQEINTGSIEGTKFFRSTYTLLTDGGHPTAFANWFALESGGSRFMSAYDTGYLQFYVRTNHDLQFSIRDAATTPGTETMLTLGQLGVPLDNNWQYVVVPLSSFAPIDFTHIQNYFTITAISTLDGVNNTPATFDVDDVQWLSIKPVADGSKIYAGLRAKQHPTTGLVLSYDLDTSSRAFTYDNALAVMNYTYQKDFTQAAAVLNSYKARFNSGGFAGFHDVYQWNVGATGAPLLDQRTAGPNAWLLLSILHYRNASLDTTFDAMAAGIGAWLKTLQAGDGGLTFGFIGTTAQTNKSTEHNFDAYAAFYGYAKAFNDGTYTTAANNVRSWLDPIDWTGSRFFLGFNGGTANGDRALDIYSWAPLALSSYTSVLNNPINGAEISFSTTNINANTGHLVDGFDFSSLPGAGDVPADKDAVWLEGTGQMALAYALSGNSTKWNYYVGQLGFAIFDTGATTQGLTYATNPGTAYGAGFIMDATHAAASSMAWYLFAKNQFNPFKPFAIQSLTVKRIADNDVASSATWSSVSAPVPAAQRWKLADQYIQLDAQPITNDPWGIQIYTDNTNPSQTPRYTDPTPKNTINLDSDPAGLIQNVPGVPVTSHKLSMAWRIQDTTVTVPTAVQPFTNLLGSAGPQSINWFFFMDRATPAIDDDGDGQVGGPNDGVAFQDGQVSYCIIRTPNGIQTQQPGSNGIPIYTPSTNPDYIYLESDFGPAGAQTPYTTQIVLEFFKT